MSLWQQPYLPHFASKGDNFLEILNLTSLNFVRPNPPTDSHTASMTAERRKLFDLLPRINTSSVAKKSPQKENHHNKDVTQNVSRVKFDVAADRKDDEGNVTSNKKSKRNAKYYRRASAPAKGLDYCYEEDRKKRSLKTPIIQVVEEHVEEHIEEHHEDNSVNLTDNNKVAKVTTVATVVDVATVDSSPCDPPPPLSPSSSISSLNSSTGMLSPGNNKPQEIYDNYWKQDSKHRIKHHTSSDNLYKSESHSLPDVVGSPYDNCPWSPAVSFLSNLAVAKKPPDEEGQQVGDYIIGKMIGHGGFSTVKKAFTINNSSSMDTVAVKIVKNNIDSNDNDRVQALLEREIVIWRRLKHPNIVSMLSVIENDYATFIFSEYCSGGTLFDYIKKHHKREGEGLNEDEARNIFLEIAEAIRYLHNDVRLVHKDVKLENILLDKDDTWKICDFGLTEFQNSANGFNDILYSDVGGSLAYCAPEQLRSPTPLKDPSVDIWSLGVVLFAMVTGQLPFSDSFQPRLQLKIMNGRYDESLLDHSRVSCDLKDLLKGMFTTRPSHRLTISEILEHRWCER